MTVEISFSQRELADEGRMCFVDSGAWHVR